MTILWDSSWGHNTTYMLLDGLGCFLMALLDLINIFFPPRHRCYPACKPYVVSLRHELPSRPAAQTPLTAQTVPSLAIIDRPYYRDGVDRIYSLGVDWDAQDSALTLSHAVKVC